MPHGTINEGYLRAEHLKEQWSRLKDELDLLDPTHTDAPALQASIQNRMNDVLAEMALVHDHTRRLIDDPVAHSTASGNHSVETLPTPPSAASAVTWSPTAAAAAITPPPIQYSFRNRHIVRRTYDSTDSESEDDRASAHYGSAMRHRITTDCSDEPIVIENKRFLPPLMGLARGLKDKLRSMPSEERRAAASSPDSQTHASSSGERFAARAAKSPRTPRTAKSATSSPPPPPPQKLSVPSSAATTALLLCPTPSPTQISPVTNPPSPPPAPLPPTVDASSLSPELGLSPTSVTLTREQRDAMAAEQSRLEREARRLKRKPDRSLADDARLSDIAVRVSKLSSRLADAAEASRASSFKGSSRGHSSREHIVAEVTPSSDYHPSAAYFSPNAAAEPATVSTKSSTDFSSETKEREKDLSRERRSSGLIPRKSKFSSSTKATRNFASGRSSSNTYGPGSPSMAENEGEDEIYFDPANDVMSPQSMRPSKTVSGSVGGNWKRKKGWTALEAGLESFKALGRSVRNTAFGGGAGGRPGERTESGGGPSGGGGGGMRARMPKTDGHVFGEVGHRLNERGERLTNAAEGTQRMANDTGDMLAAARALRERKKGKSGFLS